MDAKSLGQVACEASGSRRPWQEISPARCREWDRVDDIPDTWKRYLAAWNAKTTKQVEKELASMRKYMDRSSKHYALHGANTPPGGIADGDKVLILQEILRDRVK